MIAANKATFQANYPTQNFEDNVVICGKPYPKHLFESVNNSLKAGENIAAGYGDPASVMNGWMNSEGHRANILNGSFGQVGIGYYTDPNSGYGTYWVQIFTN